MKFYHTDFIHASHKTCLQLTVQQQIESLLEYRKYYWVNVQLHNVYHCRTVRIVSNFHKI
jgi:hypothetical protein